MGKPEKQIGDEGDYDLNADGVLRGPEKLLNLEVLLHPAEEEFDLPTALVKRSDLFGAGVEIVGENAQGFAGFDAHAYFANGIIEWILAVLGLAGGQISDAIGEDGATLDDGPVFDPAKRGVGLEPGHDPASGRVESGPPTVIVIAKVEHIARASLSRHRLGGRNVVHIGGGDRHINGATRIRVVDDVRLGAADARREPRPILAQLVQAKIC